MTETAKQEKVNQESKQEQRYYYTVMEEQEGMRLDQFLAAELKEHSRSYIQKLIKEGQVQRYIQCSVLFPCDYNGKRC